MVVLLSQDTLHINRKDKLNQDAKSGTMVGTENLSPQQPLQAHTSSTGARGILVVRDFAAVGDAANFAESHDFATTHGSTIVIDETTERGNSLERKRIHELDSEPISEPELQLPLSSVSLSEDIGPSTGNVDDRSTTEATSMNNVSPVDVYSLSGCVPDAEADATAMTPTETPTGMSIPPTEGHIQQTPKTIAAIPETKTTAKREVYKEMTSTEEEESTKKPRHEK
uniref:Uncharacterized protein n=1 Tax=Tanacetum cinerariifolium TaxID=118510 RepID=A0A6L2NUT1_TANCI|nr:hypothetical protein [Tanacetum cinerariifolium]